MPELPEVETIRRVLSPQLIGKTITDIIVNKPQVIAYPNAELFCDEIIGQRILAIDRKGKFLLLRLENDATINLHLRMTGCLYVTPPDYPLEKHTHLIFKLSDGYELRFEDARRFGKFWLIRKDEEDTYSGIEKLGIEPFDTALTAAYLMSAFGTKRKTVKECLLDQSVVCGIGNIYSDEILFDAKILPYRQAISLGEQEWATLAKSIPNVMSFFIEANVVTAEEYLTGKGKEYRNTPYFKVYGHEKEPCPMCGTMQKKQVIGGRSSVYCSNCQK